MIPTTKSENIDDYELSEYLNSIQNAPKLDDHLSKQFKLNPSVTRHFAAYEQ